MGVETPKDSSALLLCRIIFLPIFQVMADHAHVQPEAKLQDPAYRSDVVERGPDMSLTLMLRPARDLPLHEYRCASSIATTVTWCLCIRPCALGH